MKIFIYYPKCATCQKAKKWLDENNIKYEERNIVEENPKEEELKKWIKESNYEIKRFFNTSGLKYKELNLKEKLLKMTEEEKIKLLSTDGMLVKRPIVISEQNVFVGFKEKEWKEMLERK